MNALDIVKRLIGLILDLVPKEVAQHVLTEEAVRRQNALADAAELAKFPEG